MLGFFFVVVFAFVSRVFRGMDFDGGFVFFVLFLVVFLATFFFVMLGLFGLVRFSFV